MEATDHIVLEDANGSTIDLKSSTGDSFIRWNDAGVAQYSVGYDNGLDKFILYYRVWRYTAFQRVVPCFNKTDRAPAN